MSLAVHRPLRAVLIGAAALVAAAAMALGVPGPAHAATPTGCGYGANGPAASTLCWIDLTGFDPTTAAAPAGQPFAITLPGGYTASFAVKVAAGQKPIVSSGFPTWGGAAIGNIIYTGTPGRPALYQQAFTAGTETAIRLDTIVVRDAGGQVVHGWRIIGADAESTANTERITFAADTPVSAYASYSQTAGGNGCQASLTFAPDGLSVTCTGNTLASAYGTQLVAATEPTFFTQTMSLDPGQPAAAQAVAFAFQSSTVQGDISVPIRASAADTFDVTLTSPEASVVGTGTTGTASTTASTTALTVLPRVAGQPFRLTASGSNLAAYDLSWTCSRNGVADPALSATGVAGIAVQPGAGEAVACTVNAARRVAAAPVRPAASDPQLAVSGTSTDPTTGGIGGLLIAAGVAIVVATRVRRIRAR